MALQKQPALTINFAQGLDQKTDPKQVAPGRFLSLVNSVFDKGGLLQKRNGYGFLPPLPDAASTYLTTFNGNLTSVGMSLSAYATSTQTWVNKGSIQPVSLATLSLIRSNTNQSQASSVIAPNGLVCTVFTDNVPSGTSTTPVYKYVVADTDTGQNIVSPTPIPVTTGSINHAPKVYLLGNYFIIMFSNNIGGTNSLQYVAVSTSNPTNVTANATVSALFTPSNTGAFNAAVLNNALYIAWASDATNVRATYLTSTLVLATPVILSASVTPSVVSVAADTSSQYIYATWYASGTVYGASFNQALSPIITATTYATPGSITNMTSVAQNALLTVFVQVQNFYGYDGSLRSDFIQKFTVTQLGNASALSTIVRSVGIASEVFIVSGSLYLMATYQSDSQPSYFLIDSSGKVVSALAYANGGGYDTTGIPAVTVTGEVAQIAYLKKDLLESVNKTTASNVPSAAVYTQTGINLATFTFATQAIVSAEIGNGLYLTGGFLWQYDGYSAIEQGFFLYPDNIELNLPASVTYTGNTTSSTAIGSLSSTANLVPGMNVSGTGIPANTTIVSISGTNMVISNAATTTATGVSLTFTGNLAATTPYSYVATYEWTDNQGNLIRSAPSIPVTATTGAAGSFAIVSVPTLRLTYKTANPVKLVLYRYSISQPIYYQVSSITNPTLNDTTTDFVNIIDYKSDSQIIGNNLLYTTGGVLENISTPATNVVSLFDSRLFLIDAEDPNLLWYSKQVIEATPVEMSDLLTLYIAPTVSAQGSTGPTLAMAAMDDKLVLFKRNAIYYINGKGPDNTGGNNQYSEPTFITSTVGCSNQASIVFIPQGLLFQSGKGIWLLGRDLSTSYIGAPVEDFNSFTVQSAVNVPNTNQVRFTLSNGVTLMYDYYYSQWGTFQGVPAISSTIYNNLHTYLNKTGQVLQETPGAYIDGSHPVLMSFITGWLSMAGLQGYQRAYHFSFLGTYITPHKLQIGIGYNFQPVSQQTTISPNNFAGTYGSAPLFGSVSPYGGPSSLENWRVFFEQQKTQSFQLTFNEVYDPLLGTGAGAGLTISGINVTYGIKKGNRTFPAANSTS